LLPQLLHPDQIATTVGESVMAMAQRVGGAAFLRQQQAILDRPDSRPLLPQIGVPTLVAVGDGDVLTPPSESYDIHRAISGSKLHIFTRCGHLPPLERTAETTRLLREWLET
jgi:pimeloyl-ACP methyl ester carboxylesterase